jgi:phosphoglycerate dehydrogenase-like enzyme
VASGSFDILVAGDFGDAVLQRLAPLGRVRRAGGFDEASLMREVEGADALLVRTRAQVTGGVIRAGRRLRVIGRGGVGLDNIDLAAARECGVVVVYTPAASSDAVAEYTIGMLLALERHLLAGDSAVRTGGFRQARSTLVGRELRGLTIGLVGLGRIGSRVGRICANGFGMRVVFNDIAPVSVDGFAAEAVEKSHLWESADVVSLHVPLTESTRRMINRETLSRFKPGATLVNTSRGAVVESAALAEALVAGRLAGAALDVYEVEPLPADDPLMSAPNLLLSPHIASRSHRGLARMDDVVEDLAAVLLGRTPKFAV